MQINDKLKRIISGFLVFVMILSMDSGAFAYAYQDYLYRETYDPSGVSISATLVGSESESVRSEYDSENELTVIDAKTGDGYIDIKYHLDTGNKTTDGLGVILELPVFTRKDGVLVSTSETYGDAYITGQVLPDSDFYPVEEVKIKKEKETPSVPSGFNDLGENEKQENYAEGN